MTHADPTIVSVEFGELRTRYPRTVGRNARLGSHGAGPASPIAVLRTDDGRVGWGLVEEPPGSAETLIGRPLSELIGADGVREDGHLPLDAALHDLLGVVQDRPVAGLLDDTMSDAVHVPVYDGAIYFDDLDPEDRPRGIEAVLAECRHDAALGFTGFKVKIGRGHRWLDRAAGDRRDIAVTRAVREAFPRARLLVDANDGYDLTGFLRYLEAVADVDLYWVEEPFEDDPDDLLALRSRLDELSPATLIAEGETRPDVDALLPVAADGGIDVLLMDVMSFGITRWRQIMPAVRAAGAQASPHAWGRPLKTLYAAHLAVGLGNVAVVEGVPGSTEGVDPDLVEISAGAITVSERPGFGLPLPEAHLLRRPTPR